MRQHRLFYLIFGIEFLAFGLGQYSRAAIFNVADGNVAELIAAINTANSNEQTDVINLAPDGTYILRAVDNATDGANGLPSLRFQMRLGGKTREGGSRARVRIATNHI